MNCTSRIATNLLSRLLLSLAVTVSILQTPLPVAHAHSDFRSAWLLSDHLDHHHPLDDVSGDEVHWHLIIPGQPHEDEQEGSEHSASALVAAVSSTVTDSSRDSDWVACQWVPVEWYERDAMAWLGSVDTTRSAAPCTFTPAQRVCALLCVIRC